MPTGARKIDGFSDISEAVLSEQSIARVLSRKDIDTTQGFTNLKIYVNELATVANYVPGTGVSLSNDSSAFVNITNALDVAVNELLDGVTVATAPVDLVLQRLVAGIEAFAEKVDTDYFVRLATDGTQDILAAAPKPTAITIYDDIKALNIALSNAKAPKRNRFIVTTPEMVGFLKGIDAKLFNQTELGDMARVEGIVGKVDGAFLFETTLLPAGTNFIVLQERGAVHLDTWKKDPMLQSLDGSGQFIGDSAVQGRMSYNQGVVRPLLVRVHKGAA